MTDGWKNGWVNMVKGNNVGFGLYFSWKSTNKIGHKCHKKYQAEILLKKKVVQYHKYLFCQDGLMKEHHEIWQHIEKHQ